MKNRLNLDFSLLTQKERTDFLNNYIKNFNNLTNSELETMSDYILWGLDEDPDASAALYGLINDSQKTQSLDALLDSPTFNEADLSPVNQLPLKRTKEKFNR